MRAVAVRGGGTVVCGALGAHALTALTDGAYYTTGTISWAVKQCSPTHTSPEGDCPSVVTDTYGEMADWDVSQMTNFDMRFMSQSSFTADISRWNTSSATSMKLRIVGILEVHVHRVRQPHVRRQVPHRQRAAEALAVSVVHSTEICRTGMSAR